MKYILSLLILTLCACGPANVTYSADMAAYYEDFVRIVGPERVTSGRIVFETDDQFPGLIIGLCKTTAFGDWTIYIKKSVWAVSSDGYRKALLYHELTHCMLGHSGHSSDPNSYMYPALIAPANIDAQVLSFL